MKITEYLKYKQFYCATTQQVRWWAYAAWTLPLVALAGIFFVDLIGWGDDFHRAVVVGGIVFFTVAVYWWWWAIFKLARLSNLLLNTANNLKEIGDELREINQNLKQEDK